MTQTVSEDSTRVEQGKVMYDAYLAAVFGRSPLTGRTLPPWDELSDGDRDALSGTIEGIIEVPA